MEPGQGGNDENVIMLGLDASIDNPEGYELTVLPDRVTIKGQAANGVFYGLQTLRKSVPAIAYGSDIILPAAVIKDAPRFAYRGMMLDVGRHFFSVSFLKEHYLQDKESGYLSQQQKNSHLPLLFHVVKVLHSYSPPPLFPKYRTRL